MTAAVQIGQRRGVVGEPRFAVTPTCTNHRGINDVRGTMFDLELPLIAAGWCELISTGTTPEVSHCLYRTHTFTSGFKGSE